MRTNRITFYFFSLILLVSVFHLQAAGSTNKTTIIQESWETISNRWSSVRFEDLRQAADKGDVTAQYYLGCTYQDGNGVVKDLSEAFKWQKLAANNGLVRAQKVVGSMYYSGAGVPQDYSSAAKFFLLAAENGNAPAQSSIGYLYRNGLGVTKDLGESVKWYRKAADQGVAEAQRMMGIMLQFGEGVGTNLDEATAWYQKAVQQGDAQAQMNLGWMYENGIGVSTNYVEAARLYRLAAEQGHAMAQNNLGWFYYNGFGVPLDPVEAVKWYNKSAEQGVPHAEKNLAWIYAQGAYGRSNTFGQGADAQVRSGGVEPNHELAEKWMRKAVDLNSAEGQYQLGNLLHNEVDKEGHQDTTRFPEASEWFRKSAEQGYDKAQYELAEMYHHGELGERTNCIPWFFKAAAQGNAEAQAEVGKLSIYYPNSGLLKSVDVVALLRQSAENGNLDAQFQLAKRYQTGDGVPKDAVEAFKWMQKAAQQDPMKSTKVSDAQYEVGLMYEKGEGVKADLSEAHNYIILASQGLDSVEGGQPDACFRVGQWYENGDSVPHDDYRAIKYYYNAVRALNGRKYKSQAAEDLLKLYTQGRGLSKTNQEPEDFIDRELADKPAVIQKFQSEITTSQAEFYVGQIYYQGQLVPQDLVEAAARFQVAADEGLDDARKMLVELDPKMSADQKEAAKKQADRLKFNLNQQRSMEQTSNKIYDW